MKNVGKTVITVDHVSKDFKLYFDKGRSLKEKLLFWKRNRHETRKVLNDISFTVKKGESIGLIGRNGCGKSTMLKMLTKIYYPNKGKIKVDGRVSSLIELGAGFHPDMTGRENIYINASIFGLSRKEIDKRVESIIDFSEIRDFIDNPVRTYSSGMYMRLAFSVAINVDADILLIDEILAVGDANFQSKCFNKLKELKSNGITIVLVTHSMQSIIDFCEKCIWIEKGKVFGIGATNDITNKYIKYMLDEKINKTLDEHDRSMVNLELQRKQKERLNLELEEKRRKGLDATADHFGTKKALLRDVVIYNDKNQKSNVLKSGKPFKIVLEYEVMKKVDKLIFGMGFNSSDKKIVVYGTNTKIDNIPFKYTKSKGRVIFHCKSLPIQKGEYYLNVSIIDDSAEPLDYYNAYCKVLVTSSDDSIGTAYLDHYWKIEEFN